jgi:hypothetical protein
VRICWGSVPTGQMYCFLKRLALFCFAQFSYHTPQVDLPGITRQIENTKFLANELDIG